MGHLPCAGPHHAGDGHGSRCRESVGEAHRIRTGTTRVESSVAAVTTEPRHVLERTTGVEPIGAGVAYPRVTMTVRNCRRGNRTLVCRLSGGCTGPCATGGW